MQSSVTEASEISQEEQDALIKVIKAGSKVFIRERDTMMDLAFGFQSQLVRVVLCVIMIGCVKLFFHP